jgi:hypothetical protein
MNVNIKAMQEDMKAMQEKAEAERKAHHQATKEMRADQEQMMAWMDAWLADMKDTRKETTACQGKMEAHLEGEEPTSVGMEPEAAQ